jgi:hypothetical protein
MSKLVALLVTLTALCCFTVGHGSHSDSESDVRGEQDWATQHMIGKQYHFFPSQNIELILPLL